MTVTKPHNTTATTQSNKPVTQPTLPSATEKQVNDRGIAAVTADFEDDFLRGFNLDDKEAQMRFQTHPYTPPQTTSQVANPSVEYKALKPLNNRGITPVIASFGYDSQTEISASNTTDKSGNTSNNYSPAWAQEMADRYKPNQNAATSPVAQWQMQKQEEFEKDHAVFSPGKAFVGAVEKGLQDTAQAFIDTLAFGEDLLWSPVEFLNDFEPGTISDDAIFNQWAEKIRENGEKVDAKHAENIEAGGNTGKFIYDVGSATVQAIPQAVMALLTGGASTAAQTTAGLQTAANAALSPGVVSAVETIVGNMARDPQYWQAFSQNVGNSYQSAVEMLEDKSLSDEISGRGEAMSSGEIQTKAALYALGTGLISAAIERSGGIQTLPDELRHGGDYWKIIVDSAVSEGKEEALQGILDRAMQNPMLDKGYKLVSLSDEEAVFSLPAAAEEFGTGAFVGGLLSGGQALAHGVLNPAKYAVNVDGDMAGQQYTEWLKSIGAQDSDLNSLEKYNEAKYNNSDSYLLLTGYSRAVEKGDISPLVGFKEYDRINGEIQMTLIGETTATGISIESFATHFIDRVIGQTATAYEGMRCGVALTDVKDALKNPINKKPVRQMPDGDIRQTLCGEKVSVTFSIRDKRLIQVNPRRGRDNA